MTLGPAIAKRRRAAATAEPRAKRLKILTPRSEWLADVEQATTIVREQSARKLEERSRVIGLERRREWRAAGNVWRDDMSGRTDDRGDRVTRLELEPADRLQLFKDPRTGREYVSRAWNTTPAETSEHLGGVPELGSSWHLSRAKTKRELFDRVEACGTDAATQIAVVCRNCDHKTAIHVGCGSKWFCPTCRVWQVVKFRKDFERKRVGLLTAATRAGLTRRSQKKSERWGERLLTLTLPHIGTAQERIEILRATWLRFWRLLRKRLAPTLQGNSPITFDSLAHNFENGRKASAPAMVSLLELLSYLHVFEWTPGKDDMLGHPHLHVWLFSRYIDNKEILHPLWTRAYRAELRARCEIGPIQETELMIPDVRRAGDDVGNELIKYLTKDWEVSDEGAKRAAPEVFAQVYAQLDGKRLKQSSSGFAKWAVEKANVCPCCAFERERGSWCRIDITHVLEAAAEFGVTSSSLTDTEFWRGAEPTPAPLVGVGNRARELRAAWLAKRKSTWEHQAAVRARDQLLKGTT